MSDFKGLSPAEITSLICRHQGDLILEAGAGTGKTFSLIERVIHQLIEREVPLDRMLALTFTDFSAAEMRTRIYAAVNRRLNEFDRSSRNDPVFKHLNMTRRRFSRNYVSTFHSFCNRILQYFPDEVTEISVQNQPVQSGMKSFGKVSDKRIDGGFELLSDYDEILWMLEWRESFYQKYKEHSGLQRQLSRLSVHDFESFMQRLFGVGEDVLYHMATLTPSDYIRLLQRLSGEWRHESDVIAQGLLDMFSSHPKWFKSTDKIPRSLDQMLRVRITDGFSKKIFNKDEIESPVLEQINARGLELFKYLDELERVDAYLSSHDVEEQLSKYPDREAFDPNHESFWNMCDLAELALRWGMLMRFMRFDAGYFNYDDMIWLTHKLFEHNPSVVEQIRGRFDQILIDEFQDTDKRQWDIIRKLGFGKPAVKDKELLIVGDVKQAIYGFRGGDVAMMGRVHSELSELDKQEGSSSLQVIPLAYSFRSNRTIIDFSNRLFRHVFGEQSRTASYEAHHQSLSAPPSGLSQNAEAEGDIRIHRTDCRQLKTEGLSIEAEALAGDAIQLEARRTAGFLREIYEGKHPRYRSITEKMQKGEKSAGILYRRRTHMFAMEQALKEVSLSFTVAKGTRYYQRREVCDAWLLISFLLDAYDDVSLVGLLRSPMISFSDSGLLTVRMVMDDPKRDYPNFWSALIDYASWYEESLKESDRLALEQGVPFLQNLREMVPNVRVSELIEWAFFTQGPYLGGSAGDTRVRENLVKLLDVVRNLESSGRGTLFEINEFLADRIRQEAGDSEAEQPDPAPIQLMTVHGSKGLQFPMVVLPDMYAGDFDGGMQLFIADDDSDSIAWPAMAYKPGNREDDKDAEASFLFQVLKLENKKRNLAETKRLFYVAVTRAETHLLMSLARPERTRSNGSFASLLELWLKEVSSDEHFETGNMGSSRDEFWKKFRIEDLTAPDLEQLATIRALYAADVVNEGQSPAPILDRSTDIFQNAEQEVSKLILTPSGHGPIRENNKSYNDEAADAASTWRMLSPADAGTLIHRTLEMGEIWFSNENTGMSGNKNPEKLEQFWRRELITMGYPESSVIVKKNGEELLRHCTNAYHWILKKFGTGAPRRSEVSYELTARSLDGAEENSSENEGPSVLISNKKTVRGSIDMIIRDRDGKEHIVDFKTGLVDEISRHRDADSGKSSQVKDIGSKSDNDNPESRGEPGKNSLLEYARQFGFDRQIRLYRQAYQKISKKRMPESRVWLLFTSPPGGRAVTLSDF